MMCMEFAIMLNSCGMNEPIRSSPAAAADFGGFVVDLWAGMQ